MKPESSASPTAPTKEQLLRLIDALERRPNDKGRILGDIGITAIGAGLGAAAAGSLAAAAGATSIFGVTTAASWLGLTVVAATPVGWVLGSAAAAGAAAYTVSRLIRSGGMSEGKKAELLNQYREEAHRAEAKEVAGNITSDDRNRFIISLRDLISHEVIPPDVAFRFVEQVERGGLPISRAFLLINDLLSEVDIGTPVADGARANHAEPSSSPATKPTASVEPSENLGVNVDKVVKDEIRFKSKLAIGENAYAELRTANAVRKYWDLFGAMGGGAALAKSSFVASTFFAPHGLLGLVGLGTAVTPVGWVLAAAAGSGLAWYGVMHALGGATEARVSVIPKCINTPMDIIGSRLFDLMMPLALKVALADGAMTERERQQIRHYFVDQWGYDPNFVDAGMALIESRLDQFSIAAVADELAGYKKSNPDCNDTKMAHDLIAFLREVMEADGAIDEREELVLNRVEQIFVGAGRKPIGEAMSGFQTGISARVGTATQALTNYTKKFRSALVDGVDALAKSETADDVSAAARKGAAAAVDTARTAAKSVTKAAADLYGRFKK